MSIVTTGWSQDMVISKASVIAPVGQAPDKEDEEQHPTQTLHQHLVKTRTCKGFCAPNLWKTRLCQAFEKGLCRNGASCTFAHGKQELIRPDLFYKKTLCSWFEKGRCRNGDRCCFAHGADELRGPRTPSELSGSAQRKMHVTSSLSVSTISTEHAVVEDAQDAHGLSQGLSALALDAPRGVPAPWGLGGRLSPAAATLPPDVSYVSPGAFSVPPRAFFVPPGAPSPEFTANSALMTPMKIHSSLVLG